MLFFFFFSNMFFFLHHNKVKQFQADGRVLSSVKSCATQVGKRVTYHDELSMYCKYVATRWYSVVFQGTGNSRTEKACV